MELETNTRYTAYLIIQAYITYNHSIAIRGGEMSRTEWLVHIHRQWYNKEYCIPTSTATLNTS
jgi:hypothetical protein